jgi:hypothetical protein
MRADSVSRHILPFPASVALDGTINLRAAVALPPDRCSG